MAKEEEIIYESPASEPDDAFWLQQGRKMLAESISAVRDAAKSLMTAVGVLQGIYLGILGFADFIPKSMPLMQKALFVLPLLLWLVATYQTLLVLLTKQMELNLRAPDSIREHLRDLLVEKQSNLKTAFWFLATGLVLALFGLLLRLHI